MDVEFTMICSSNMKILATAQCIVTGGPEYPFKVQGESNTVAFSLDRSIVDFGKVVYVTRKEEELFITNSGKVSGDIVYLYTIVINRDLTPMFRPNLIYPLSSQPSTLSPLTYPPSQPPTYLSTHCFKVIFDYSISLSPSAAGILEISPATGKILPGDKQRVVFTVRPAAPCNIAEAVSIRVAHFEAVNVTCYCQGIFPAIVVTLPRQKKIGPYGETPEEATARWAQAVADGTAVDDGPVKDGLALLLDIWSDFVATATENVLNPNPSLLPPPSPQDYPPLAAGTTALPPMASLTLTAAGLPPPAPTAPSTPFPRGKSALGYKGPKKGLQTVVEVEMQRMLLERLLSQSLDEILSGTFVNDTFLTKGENNTGGLNSPGQSRQSANPGTSASTRALLDKNDPNTLQSLITRNIDTKSLITATYLCDFGNVIAGLKRKKVFKIFNATNLESMTWVFDKKVRERVRLVYLLLSLFCYLHAYVVNTILPELNCILTYPYSMLTNLHPNFPCPLSGFTKQWIFSRTRQSRETRLSS